MQKAKFLLPVIALVMWLAGPQSANAQMVTGSSCGGGVIEMVNFTNCDHDVNWHYWYLGNVYNLSIVVPAGGSAEACYDHTTTAVLFVEVSNLNTFGGVSVNNPGYPGINTGGIPGCTRNEHAFWENDVSTGPGHVTNLFINP